MLDFILLLLGPIFLITGLYGLFNVEKEALKSKEKLEKRNKKKGKTKTSSLEKLKRQVRISGICQVLLGLLLVVLMFGRLNVTIMEANELVLAQGEEQSAVNYDYEKILKQFLEQHSVPGLVAGIVNGQDSFLYVYGLEGLKTKRKVNETTIFEIGSISKAVTGLMLAESVFQGDISLENTVKDIVHDSDILDSESIFKDVTMKDLTTHTSGLPRLPNSMGFTLNTVLNSFTGGNPYGDFSQDDLYKEMKRIKNLKGHKEKWAYSNYGTSILGVSLSKARNQTYEEMLTQIIANPIGMMNTSVLYHEDDQMNCADGYSSYFTIGELRIGIRNKPWLFGDGIVAAGGIRSTGEDMLLFLDALVHNKLPFIKLSTEELFSVNEDMAMGMGWIIDHSHEQKKDFLA